MSLYINDDGSPTELGKRVAAQIESAQAKLEASGVLANVRARADEEERKLIFNGKSVTIDEWHRRKLRRCYAERAEDHEEDAGERKNVRRNLAQDRFDAWGVNGG